MKNICISGTRAKVDTDNALRRRQVPASKLQDQATNNLFQMLIVTSDFSLCSHKGAFISYYGDLLGNQLCGPLIDIIWY